MSRPTVTIISAKGESTKDTLTVPNVFKVSLTPLFAISRWGANFVDEIRKKCTQFQWR